MSALRTALADETGSSLAEVAVAAVLLVTVLVPTALAVVALTGTSAVGERGEALVRARTAMEETLAEPPSAWRTGTAEDGAWRTARTVQRDGGPAGRYVSVGVAVSRGRSGPLVTLVGGRFDPDADE